LRRSNHASAACKIIWYSAPVIVAEGDRVTRREFMTLIGAAVAWPATSRAQDRVRVIAILETVSPELNSANLDALRRGLRELGYTEGQSIRLEYRSAEGQASRFPALAAEVVHLKVALIVTRGTPAAIAAKKATSTIPIVMAAIGEPVDTGVVPNLARPGGNVTGFSALVTELTGKRVELTKQVIPSVTRVGFLSDMSNPVNPPQWEETQKAAQSLGIEAELLDVRNKEDIPRGFEKAAHSRIDGLIVGVDAVTQQHGALIAILAERQQLPTICGSREYVEAGALMSYGVSYPDLYRRAAGMVDKIFKGAKPGDLPVEQPTKFELVINGKTAKAIGIKVPPVVLIRADEVIE
jgi:putative ABC transport system substrate-binding protein